MKGGVASFGAWCAVVMVVVLVGAQAQETEAANCSPLELTPCLGAIMGSGEPTPECCAKLKEQVPCFCGYLKNPAFRQYIDSPNAKKVAATCGLQQPTCN